MATTKPSVLLPAAVKPLNYKLELTPNFQTFKFEGLEEIELNVKEETDVIISHAHELEIVSAEIGGPKGRKSIKSALDKENQRISFHLEEKLNPGENVSLFLKFVGTLNDSLAGFYRSKYRTPEGVEKYMATTQFEAVDARRALVCWDEPAVKATFEVTLNVPADLMAISNMPVIDTTKNEDGTKKVRFEKTPIMSTYLLAFIVGEFDYLEGQSKEGINIRVYTPVGKKEQGAFALDVAKNTLSYYAELFEIPYPLPKLDLLAIPDFAAGAMENWGAVTYREARLLIDPTKTTTQIKQAILKTINHEISHMWFGNLVTMQWWTHLWLNEGFARYMEHVAVEKFFPEYQIWNQFASSVLSSALSLDSLKSTHPIEVDVKHPDEINEIFDTISYAKGASVIRMLVDFIGPAFYDGVRKYLKKHQFSNAVTEHLWEALAEASGKPIQKIMDTWTKQAGFPMITITEKGVGKDGVRTFHLKQSRFLSGKKAEQLDEEERSKRWIIPVSIVSPHEKKSILMETEETEVSIHADTNDWIKLNNDQAGFYRSNYSADLLSKLIPHIKKLPVVDRLGLLNDAFSMVLPGYLPTTQFLELAEQYSEEEDYAVLSSLVSNLAKVRLLVDRTDLIDDFKAFGRKVLRRTYESTGWDPKPDDTHLTSLLRTLTINTMANMADDAFVAEARKRFHAFLEGKPIAADIKSAIFKTVISHGNQQDYETVLKLYKESQHVEEKNCCLSSLGQTKIPELLQKTLDMALSQEVRSQDIVYPISGVASNPHGRELIWNWFKQNFANIEKQFKEGQNFIFSGIIDYSTAYFVELEKAHDVAQFFASHPAPSSKRTIDQAIEGITSSAEWLSRDHDDMKKWLKKQLDHK